MKKSQITFIVISLFVIALMATNPSTEEYKEAVKEKISAAIENNNSNVNVFQKLGQTMGMALIDKMIKRENYLIFSIIKVKLLDKYKNEKVVGFGILGKVYLIDDISENITEKIKESSNLIIGNTYKIENIEVAEKDFPNRMNWEDAKKACQSLGNGWRLPNKDELNLLYQNKYKIGGFAYDFCWSSTVDSNGDAWVQRFYNGEQYYGSKLYLYYVRAVRVFKQKLYLNIKESIKIEALKKNILKETIGSPIKIGNLEISEKDFPNTMNWEDAKKACENLGRGWRLPTKDELNTLYINKDKIGGFADDAYWSSFEDGKYYASGRDFLDGNQLYSAKYRRYHVRAVRAF